LRALVFLGAPGSGKGTQGKKLAERRRMPLVVTGELLRRHVRENTEIGRTAKGYMDRGELVPDDIVIQMIQRRIQEPDSSSGVILDGFPRTIKQATALDRVLGDGKSNKLVVVKIEVPEENLLKRLTGRRVCRQCGGEHHLLYDPPLKAGTCNRCSGELYQRKDDREDTIRARLDVYQRETLPLDEYYEKSERLRRIDGQGTIDEVSRQVENALAESLP
jgi:adenylate kinase